MEGHGGGRKRGVKDGSRFLALAVGGWRRMVVPLTCMNGEAVGTLGESKEASSQGREVWAVETGQTELASFCSDTCKGRRGHSGSRVKI